MSDEFRKLLDEMAKLSAPGDPLKVAMAALATLVLNTAALPPDTRRAVQGAIRFALDTLEDLGDASAEAAPDKLNNFLSGLQKLGIVGKAPEDF